MKCDIVGCVMEAKRICHFDGEKNWYVCLSHRDLMEYQGQTKGIAFREQPIGVHLMEGNSESVAGKIQGDNVTLGGSQPPHSPSNRWKTCDRCGTNAEKLYTFDYIDEDTNEPATLFVCWDCDHDIMNGGEPFEDPATIYQSRMDEAYAYDPINEVRTY